MKITRDEISGLSLGYRLNVMRSLSFWGVICALCLAGPFCALLSAQSYLTSTGVSSFSTPYPAEMGTVDAASGNLHLEIPLGSFSQRAGSALVPKLVYDSHMWIPEPIGLGEYQWFPIGYVYGLAFETWGFTGGVDVGLYNVGGNGCNLDYMLLDETGRQHYFNIPGSSNENGCNGGTAYATDSSGLQLVQPGLIGQYMYGSLAAGSVYAPDGTQVYGGGQGEPPTIVGKDPNGNYFSLTNTEALPGPGNPVIDTLDRTMVNVLGGNSTTSPVTLQVMNSSGGVSDYVVNFSTIPVKTNFGSSGINECNECEVTVITSIKLPDGTSSYSFLYDCDETTGNAACNSPGGQSGYYGTLTSMTLPTLATITYGYSMFDGVSWGGSSNEYPSRWLTSKTSSAGLWTYSPAVTAGAGTGNSCLGSYQVGCMNVQVNRPDGSFEITGFIVDPYGGSWPQVIQSKSSSGTLLSTVNNVWDFSNVCTLNLCGGKGYQDVRKLSTSTTIPVPTGNITKQTTYTYDTPQTANITQIKEWKYQSGTFPSIPDRATYLTYSPIGTNNDINHPTVIAVCNNTGTDPDCPGGGSKVAKTTILYDKYGQNGSLALTSTQANVTGVFNHDDTNFGSSNTTRGNPTLISRWVSGTSSGVTCGSMCLTTVVSYDITGQVIQVLDSNNNLTTYSYADVFYNDNGDNPPASFTPKNSSGGTITTNSYVTSETDNIGLTSAGYYYRSGNPAKATDYNSFSTFSHYVNLSDIQDPFDRLTQTVYPIGWSLNTYTSPTQFDSYSPIGSATASTGCTSCLHTEALLDTLGRVTSQSLVNNPSGQSYETATYDSLNRAATVSHPNFGVTDPNDVVETPHYDGLSRSLGVTHSDGEFTQIAYGASVTALGGLSTQQSSGYGVGFPILSVDEAGNLRQEWLDGFGRVIEVDEPSVAGKLTSPFVTNYTYDALGNLTNVLQGVQTRTYQYDGLSRLTMEETPEASTTTNGVTVQNPVTWSYVAAGGALCSGNPSNPCTKTDARGIVTTYSYYTSNLLRQKTHSDTTGTEVYTYGTSAPSLGRLTKMTDPSGSETYTYDSMGRVTSLAKVIGSITYNIGYQYNTGGQLTQVTYPSGRNVYYVYDNVGHLCLVSAVSATSCSSSSPYLTMPSTAYDAANRPRTAIYGNGMVAAAVYSPQRSQLLSLSYGGGTLSISVVGTISCSSVPVTCEATVTSSAGFNAGDTITISGNNNSLLNGSFTVDGIPSGTTVVFYAADSLSGITGSGGTLTDNTSGVTLSASVVGTISCSSIPVNCEATVTSSAGFNAVHTITISGNSNPLLNGSFTVDAVSSGTTILVLRG
jgi:YD repeat-containing protein